MEATHITWHPHRVSRADREQLNGHRGCVVWFTGLSGCGKSTVANEVEHRLQQRRVHSYLLDGDNVRHHLNASPAILEPTYGAAFATRFGLGFSADDRAENIRRIGSVAQLFAAAGLVTLAAFVSPYRRDRQAVREQVEKAGRVGDFIEVYVRAPLELCEARDPKGLYQKARAGELKGFTGIDDPYEEPASPELVLESAQHSPDVLAEQVMAYLIHAGILQRV
jgi:adenylylsulfate kinase